MRKIIWTCWFQGRENAPPVVRTCLNSWEQNNPGWEFRCLDATSLGRYVSLRGHFDLDRQSLTAASLSDVLRIFLLHEFGGVWVDATLLCNRPLDDWLPEVMDAGFFAFAAPASDRPLSSWFLSAEPGHPLVAAWFRSTIEYWANRSTSDDYFWFHHLFRDMCRADHRAATAWSKVPKISADGPHALQFGECADRVEGDVPASIDDTTPVFKLTYRLSEEGLRRRRLLQHVLAREAERHPPALAPRFDPPTSTLPAAKSFAALKVSTENLGDHIQILSGLRLLSRLGIEPARYIDRDDEIASAPNLAGVDGPVGILLNGWFKTNCTEWPPHPKLAPLVLGFHIRLFQCPELVSAASIDFFRSFEPIGCRDIYTESLLKSNAVDAFTSNCLSLTFPRRIDDPHAQTEVFVVSRDERIKAHVAESIGPYTFVSHYSGSSDFPANMARAEELLETYRSRAKLIVTTLLHCALPAIAMGIPVVVFYPLNDERAHGSDRERFSALDGLVPVHRLEDLASVDWRPGPLDVSAIKLRIFDRFYELATRWGGAPVPALGPIAPPSALPAPSSGYDDRRAVADGAGAVVRNATLGE